MWPDIVSNGAGGAARTRKNVATGRSMRNALIAIAVIALGYFGWTHYFSRDAKIERAFQSCVSKMNAGVDQGKVKSTDEAMASMMKGIGGAMCGMIKEACKQDFNGPVCQAAINSSR
jgi:hypothetical protein